LIRPAFKRIMPPVIGEWGILAAGLLYLGALFGVATYGDRMAVKWNVRSGRPLIYALSIAVYCTSWTYFGSVGIASRNGLDFLRPATGSISCPSIWGRSWSSCWAGS
jgi:Na+/proline symporter